MASPPSFQPGGGSSGGSSGGGKKKNKPKQKYQQSPSVDPKHNPWVVYSNGHISFSNTVAPPANALTSFGLPIKRSDFLQAQSHYNDLFRAWVGRGVKGSELARILSHGVSDFALQLHFTHMPGFKKSAVYRSYQTQANAALGFKYNLKPGEIRQALLGGGDLQSALAGSKRAQNATVRDFRRSGQAQDANQLLGSFGPGELNRRQTRALALGSNNLQHSTLEKKLQSSLDKALQRYQRIFQGNAATPSLSLGAGGLQAPSLLGNKQEPDVAA